MVHLSRDVLAKINREHPDLADFTFLELPHLIRHGLWVGDRDKPLCAVASCEGAYTPSRYRVAIKRSAHGLDLWVSSFYRTKPRATRSLLKRGDVIRMHTP